MTKGETPPVASPSSPLLIDPASVQTIEQEYHMYGILIGLPGQTPEASSRCRRRRIALGLAMLRGRLQPSELAAIEAKKAGCVVGAVTSKLDSTLERGRRMHTLSIANNPHFVFEVSEENLALGQEIVKNNAQRECEYNLSVVDEEVEGLLIEKGILKWEYGAPDPNKRDNAERQRRVAGSRAPATRDPANGAMRAED